MRVYPAFANFHGMEETIERIVGSSVMPRKVSKSASRCSICWDRSAAAIVAGRAPEVVDGSQPIYVLKAGEELSPVFESPLGLFDPEQLGPMIEEKYASRAAA